MTSGAGHAESAAEVGERSSGNSPPLPFWTGSSISGGFFYFQRSPGACAPDISAPPRLGRSPVPVTQLATVGYPQPAASEIESRSSSTHSRSREIHSRLSEPQDRLSETHSRLSDNLSRLSSPSSGPRPPLPSTPQPSSPRRLTQELNPPPGTPQPSSPESLTHEFKPPPSTPPPAPLDAPRRELSSIPQPVPPQSSLPLKLPGPSNHQKLPQTATLGVTPRPPSSLNPPAKPSKTVPVKVPTTTDMILHLTHRFVSDLIGPPPPPSPPPVTATLRRAPHCAGRRLPSGLRRVRQNEMTRRLALRRHLVRCRRGGLFGVRDRSNHPGARHRSKVSTGRR